MTEPDCTFETTTVAIDAYLEGMVEGNTFADDLDKLVELSQKLGRDLTCLVTVKFNMNSEPENDE